MSATLSYTDWRKAMTDSKYYWLKLKRDFFKRHDIRIVEGMPNGKEYILFYLKLLCESVDHEGSLRFSDQIPYNEDMLAIITNTNVDIVRSAVKVFTELKMMEILDDGTIFMSEVEGMIGSASNTDNANRQRRFRERQKALELTENDGIACIPVTEALRERYASVTKSNESKSKSKSIEKEIDINSADSETKKSKFSEDTEEIISYLNSKAGTHYRNVDSNRKLITARMKEGYTVEDFKTVIDKKCDEWKGTDMQQFIRPVTLFQASKFENYLNAPVKKKQQNVVIPMPDFIKEQETAEREDKTPPWLVNRD